jgi:ribonucleoside-diphosphate reductase beta chain
VPVQGGVVQPVPIDNTHRHQQVLNQLGRLVQDEKRASDGENAGDSTPRQPLPEGTHERERQRGAPGWSASHSVRWGCGRHPAERTFVSESVTQRTERADFQATSDPAVLESADRGEVHLLTYEQLYNLWERQQWATQDIDFTRDRIDWHERIPPKERRQRMYGLSSFFIGEQKVADELGPIMRAAPTEEMRVFLCTQIADEARHVRFFNRFYDEVGVLEADTLPGRLAETREHLNPEFDELFDEMLKSRVDRLARNPHDLEALVEAVTIYHMVIEGMLALTGQHFILQYNEEVGTLPGFVEGFNKIARDEHRHVAFGARFLREMAVEDSDYGDAITRTLVEVGPTADGVLQPKWYVEGETEVLGATVEETRAFAMKALERRLKVIGLTPVA